MMPSPMMRPQRRGLDGEADLGRVGRAGLGGVGRERHDVVAGDGLARRA